MRKTTVAAILVSLMTLGAPAAQAEVLEYDMPNWAVSHAGSEDLMSGNLQVLANAAMSPVHAHHAAALEGVV